MTRGVITYGTHKIFLSVMNRQVSLQQGLPAEASTAVEARVTMVMKYHRMFSERRLCGEEYSAALHKFGASSVHGEHVSFEIITSVRGIPTFGTREKLPIDVDLR